METTGLDPTKHRAIDVGLKVVDISVGVVKGDYQSIVRVSPEMWARRDPVSMEINGISWELVNSGKEPALVSQEIIEFLTRHQIVRGKSVFICQNPGFDRAFFAQLVDVYTQEKLLWPYHWLDLASMYWALLVQRNQRSGSSFPDVINLSKNEIAREHRLPPEQQPHRSMNGVNHLILCYESVLGIKFQNSH
ncbi:MAG: 3'-5' exonuclease [Parachlamydia sp.]|nr:3'-5' exonuclease [Parachlamydia sp.]